MPVLLEGRVVGTWVQFNGRPTTGYVVLVVPENVRPFFDDQAVAGMTGHFIRIPLVGGEIDRFVPATDDTSIFPSDWLYHVHYYFDGGETENFFIAVPRNTVTDIPTAVHENYDGGTPDPSSDHALTVHIGKTTDVHGIADTSQLLVIGDSRLGEVKTQAAPAASWNFAHGLGRLPSVSIYLDTGEEVDADIMASANEVTVVWPSPMSGSLVLT